MTENILFEEIKQILSAYGTSPIEIDTDLRSELNLTSFDVVQIIGEIEEKYNIEILEEEISQFITIRDLIGYIMLKKQ